MDPNCEPLLSCAESRHQDACSLEQELLERTFRGPLLFRRATIEDEPFLFQLFAETRSEDLAQLLLAKDQLDFLVTMQYQGLQMTYAAQFPAARLFILCGGDGAAVGKVLLALQADHCRIVDLAVARSARRRGLGTLCILACQQACRRRCLSLRLAVSSQCSARTLYVRAGFVERNIQDAISVGQHFTTGENTLPLFRELEWRP